MKNPINDTDTASKACDRAHVTSCGYCANVTKTGYLAMDAHDDDDDAAPLSVIAVLFASVALTVVGVIAFWLLS